MTVEWKCPHCGVGNQFKDMKEDENWNLEKVCCEAEFGGCGKETIVEWRVIKEVKVNLFMPLTPIISTEEK